MPPTPEHSREPSISSSRLRRWGQRLLGSFESSREAQLIADRKESDAHLLEGFEGITRRAAYPNRLALEIFRNVRARTHEGNVAAMKRVTKRQETAYWPSRLSFEEPYEGSPYVHYPVDKADPLEVHIAGADLRVRDIVINPESALTGLDHASVENPVLMLMINGKMRGPDTYQLQYDQHGDLVHVSQRGHELDRGIVDQRSIDLLLEDISVVTAPELGNKKDRI